MEQSLRLALLGNLEVRRGAVLVPGFSSAKAQALLCYLALTGCPHPRSALASLLWGEMPEANAQNNLRKALSLLRSLFAAHVTITRQTVSFNRDSPHWLDVTEFDDLIATSKAHEHRQMEAWPACAGRLQRAAELYRGELLAGFSGASAPFEEWLTLERERTHRQVLDALQHLAAFHEGRGEYGEAQRQAHRQLELAPWREVAHRVLMRTLAKSGQRSAALAQYESCRRTLEEEQGV